MSRSGNVWDSAGIESFFSSLKTERTAQDSSHAVKPRLMCSTILNASTIRNPGAQRAIGERLLHLQHFLCRKGQRCFNLIGLCEDNRHGFQVNGASALASVVKTRIVGAHLRAVTCLEMRNC